MVALLCSPHWRPGLQHRHDFLIGNQTSDPLAWVLALNPSSHTSWAGVEFFYMILFRIMFLGYYLNSYKHKIFIYVYNFRYAIPPEHGKRLERLAQGKPIFCISYLDRFFVFEIFLQCRMSMCYFHYFQVTGYWMFL